MRFKFGIGNYPPLRVKIEETFFRGFPSFRVPSASKKPRLHRLASALLLPTLLSLAVSCESDRDTQESGDGMTVELNIITRAITSDSYTYEVGSTWENYIDIAGGDYKIYFFTNDKDDATATSDDQKNKLISEFIPRIMTADEGSVYTKYTLMGGVDDKIAEYSDFKIVVLANWGTYPSVTVGTTTIDNLVEGDNTTFSAETFLNGVDESHLIPFYGVREYSGVEWRQGWRTTLSGDITLLRAVAKVEVIMSEDSDFSSFDSVSIAGYNSTGYCAPKGVYLRADYDHNYTWEQDFTEDIHLVGGANDSDAASNTYSFNRQSGTATDTWAIYLPEYDNLTGGFSSIRLSVSDAEHEIYAEYEIYFANYVDGETESTADYNIFRNYLYRFRVRVLENTIRVYVNEWEDLFENEYTFN